MPVSPNRMRFRSCCSTVDPARSARSSTPSAPFMNVRAHRLTERRLPCCRAASTRVRILRADEWVGVASASESCRVQRPNARAWLLALRLAAEDWGTIIARLIAVNDAEHVAGVHLNSMPPCRHAAPIRRRSARSSVPRATRWTPRGATGSRISRSSRRIHRRWDTDSSTLRSGCSPGSWRSYARGATVMVTSSGPSPRTKSSRTSCATGRRRPRRPRRGSTTNTGGLSTRGCTTQLRASMSLRVLSPSPRSSSHCPRDWAEAQANLVHYAPQPRGQHFPAMEQPELFVEEVRAFFRLVRQQ
jgi:pimeloyl-ACP methyl ester carboxylesterase